MTFDISVIVELMPIFLMQSSSEQSVHASLSIAVGGFVDSKTCRGIPPRASQQSRNFIVLGNNGAIASIQPWSTLACKRLPAQEVS